MKRCWVCHQPFKPSGPNQQACSAECKKQRTSLMRRIKAGQFPGDHSRIGSDNVFGDLFT